MSVKRGDIVLAWYPFASRMGGKRRPCLVIQNDADIARLTNTVIAQITSNLRAASELHDSLVSCNNLATIEQTLVTKHIGFLSASMMQQVEVSLKIALSLR